MRIKETVNLLARVVSELKVTSKLIVTKQQSGHMSPKMKRQFDSLFEARTEVNSLATDINNLPPGSYVGGSNLIGMPETQMGYEWFLEISKTANGDKMFYATNIPTGSTWKKVFVHGDASGLYFPRNWSKVTTETILWNGSADVAVEQIFTLGDDWTHYDGLVVTYSVNGTYGSVRMQVPRSDVPTGVPSQLYFTGVNLSNTLSINTLNIDFVEAHLQKVDNKSLKLDSFNHIIANLAKGTAKYNIGQGSFSINTILGVR